MRIFEPHAHMTSRTTDDYEAMAAAGVRAVVEPAFWLGQPRTSVGTVRSTTSTRCSAGSASGPAQFGIRHHCTIGAQPQGGQRRPRSPRGARAAAALPGQGRRRRGRRDRLRRDDAGRGGRRLRRASSSWRPSSSCRRWCTPRTATRLAGTQRDAGRWSSESGTRARAGADRPQQRADASSVVRRLGLLDGLLDLPGHEDVEHADGRASSRRYGPERDDRQLAPATGAARTR